MIADVKDAPVDASGRLPTGFAARGCRPADATRLGRLCDEANEAGGAGETVDGAGADARAATAGACGEPWAASEVVTHGDELVVAVLAVRRAPGEGTPDCPFIIELLTARAYRFGRTGGGVWPACWCAAAWRPPGRRGNRR